jgi:hypothetical protein
VPAFNPSDGLVFRLFSADFSREKADFSSDLPPLIIPQNTLFFLFIVHAQAEYDILWKSALNANFHAFWSRLGDEKRRGEPHVLGSCLPE